MAQHLTLTPVSDVPADATVRHVDELDEGTLDAIQGLDGETRLNGVCPTALGDGDHVKFTDYYRVDTSC